jgi:hypothetical protein
MYRELREMASDHLNGIRFTNRGENRKWGWETFGEGC